MDISIDKKLTVQIQKLSFGGDGIARVPTTQYRELVIFTPYAAPGDQVEIVITKKSKNFARGKILRVLQPGPQRTNPPCPYYFSPDKKIWCGGCNLQHLSYAAQLEEKRRFIQENLEKIAGAGSDCVLPAIGMPNGEEWRYRNKVQVPFGGNGNEIISGFFAPGSHELIEIDDCLLHSEAMMRFVRFVRAKMREWKIPPYSEKNHTGWLRHLFIREEKSSGKMLAVFVTREDFFPNQEQWREQMQREFPQVVGTLQNINPDRTNVILGKKWKKVSGQDFLMEKLSGLGPGGSDLKLKVSAGSFFQVNTRMAETLYAIARDFAVREEPRAARLLLDLYCGVGGIALAGASDFDKVIGVDETPTSVSDALSNALLNQARNCRFEQSDVAGYLRSVEFQSLWGETGAGNAVVLDPPRAGCAEEVLRQIAALRPVKIVYVSCDPSTLARDIQFLSAHRYRLKKVQPVDLFPQSAHIESVSLLALE